MGHVLVVSGSGRGRAAGIWAGRAHPLARALAERLGGEAVTVAYPADLPAPSVTPAQTAPYRDPDGLRSLLGAHEVVVARCVHPGDHHELEGRLLALDCATWPLDEWDEGPAAGSGASPHFWNYQLTLADHLLTASEEQRDLVLGQMMALGLLSVGVYDADPSLRAYAALVPQGVQCYPATGDEGDEETRWVVWSAVGDHAADAATVLEAMRRLASEGPEARLVALDCASFRYRPEAAAAARTLARRMGMADQAVVFVPGPPGSPGRARWVALAAAAVRAFSHRDAARYRLPAEEAELVGGGAPVASTAGDAFAERVARDPLGLTSDPGDPVALAANLRRLLEDQGLRTRCREGAGRLAEQLAWDVVVEPVVAFCRSGPTTASPKAERRLALLRRSLGDQLANRLGNLGRP